MPTFAIMQKAYGGETEDQVQVWREIERIEAPSLDTAYKQAYETYTIESIIILEIEEETQESRTPV